MKQLYEDAEFTALLKENRVVICLFGSASCGPCSALKKKIDDWNKGFPSVACRYISVDESAELAAQHQVLSVPTVITYIDGKKVIHQGGYFSLDAILKRMEELLEMIGC